MGYSCYGRSYGKLPSCDGCECASYCGEAGDIRLMNHAELASEPPAHDPPSATDDKAIVLTEVIEAAVANPEDWRIVSIKMRHPDWPLSKIARHANLKSKQLAQYRIQRFCHVAPEVFDALLFNRNFNHGKVSERYLKRIPSWDKREKHRKARLQHPTLPGLC